MTSINKKPVVVWGASGHALVASNIIHLSEKYYVAGYAIDIENQPVANRISKCKIYRGPKLIDSLQKDSIKCIALGFGHCSARVTLAQKLEAKGFELATLVHPTAVIAEDVKIGKGTVIGAGVVIDPECIVGNYVIINNSATICHETTIGDGTHVCPGVTICGKVSIGARCWIGAGTSMIEKVKVGDRCFVGIGSVVVNSIEDRYLVYGNPAKKIKIYENVF